MLAQFTARQINKLIRLVLLLLLVFPNLPTPVAYAVTRTVTNANDSLAGSLRQTIADASAGDVINFNGDYSINLLSQLTITKTLTIDGTGHTVTISGNHTHRIFQIFGVRLTLNNLNIVDGRDAGDGGGIQNNGGILIANNSTLSGHISDNAGGAIKNSGILTATNGTFYSNTAQFAGAIYNDYVYAATIMGCTFLNNTASDAGGAIYNDADARLTIANSTFSGNSDSGAASLVNDMNTTTTIVNSTFAGNNGGIYSDTPVIVKNTIVANNTPGPNCSGAAFASGSTNNLSNDGTCSGGFTQSSTLLLSSLTNHGGSTQTIALLPNSAAIDAGDDATCNDIATVKNQDQRGVYRSGNGAHCDVGAYESQGFWFEITSGTPQTTHVNSAFANPLTLLVHPNFPEPVDGGQVVFTGPSSGASTNPITFTATISGGGVSRIATANGIAGGPYNVTITARGASPSVNFSLTNIPWHLNLPLILR